MKTIYLEVETKSVRVEKDYKRDFLWFDAENKKLKKFNGGSLQFDFDLKTKKLVPRIEDVKNVFYEQQNNANRIRSWIKANETILDIELNERESGAGIIAVDVSDGQELFVKSMLDRLNIRYT